MSSRPSVFLAIVGYMAIGGLLIYPVAAEVSEKCSTPTKTQDFAALVIVWPALFVAAGLDGLFGPERDGDICTDDSAQEAKEAPLAALDQEG